MFATSEAELMKCLFGDSELDPARVQQIMLRARGIEAGDFELANGIIPEAGKYLPSHAIEALIRADVSDDETNKELLRQRKFFARLSSYLPSLLRYFSFDPKDQVFNAISCIDDCFGDFHFAGRSQRRDKEERKALQSFASAIDAAESALAALQSVHWTFETEFEQLHALYSMEIRKESSANYSVRALIDDIKVCIGALNIARVRAETEDDYLIVSGNNDRTVVVKYAHTMSKFWNGPALVTTPGSEFSAVCSLLFEIVSGIQGESLAGAINRYARSQERKKADREELEDIEDYNLTETDNFFAAKKTCKYSLRKIETYRMILETTELNETARLLIKLVVNGEVKKIKTAMEEYGPHLVWFNQLGPDRINEIASEFELSKRRAKDLSIELGKIRRQGRSDRST
jgi:hypothetical protein